LRQAIRTALRALQRRDRSGLRARAAARTTAQRASDRPCASLKVRCRS
jgi:hypothetical protein